MGERCAYILTPDCVPGLVSLVRRPERVVYSRDEQDQVTEEGGDFVEQDALAGELFATREGVD